MRFGEVVSPNILAKLISMRLYNIYLIDSQVLLLKIHPFNPGKETIFDSQTGCYFQPCLYIEYTWVDT